MASLADLGRGVHKHPLKAAGYVFAAFSVISTTFRAVTYFVPGVTIEGIPVFVFVVIVSLCYGLNKVWKPSKIEIKIANTNTSFEVLFGDLFCQDGIRAIAVTEFFDSKIGKPVSNISLHGLFLQKCFGSQPESFDKQVSEQLNNQPSEEVVKEEGKTKKYPIGTTAMISVNNDRYMVFALAKADPKTCKAYTDVKMMWDALHQVWKVARNESGGHPLNLPLIGSGLSGLGLPARDILNLIILSAITETKLQHITNKIRIILHRSCFEKLDLREIKEHWEE